MSESIIEIDECAFVRCYNLTSITVDEKNKNYSSENDVLYDKEKTTLIYCVQGKRGSLTIPNGVKYIGDYAFFECSKITHITLPDSVIAIRDCAFLNCSDLNNITLSDSIQKIQSNAFSGCSSLTHISIPSSVEEIGNGAFSYCLSLNKVTIPDNVKKISGSEYAFEYGAFFGCENLKNVTILNSNAEIGENAFGYYSDGNMIDKYKVSDFTIYGKSGSAAEKYAKDNDFAFVEI